MTLTESVALGYLHSFTVTSVFADAIFRTYEYERDRGEGRLWRTLSLNAGAMQVDRARNDVAQLFLDQSDKEWLWFVDSDIGFPPSTLERLQTAAIDNQLDVVAGLYHGVWGAQTHDNGAVEYEARPLMYSWNNEENRFLHIVQLTPGQHGALLEVDGTGAGCMLIRRSTLEAVREEFQTWFTPIELDNEDGRERLSEDLSFCLRVRRLGLRIAVDTGAQVIHQKPAWF